MKIRRCLAYSGSPVFRQDRWGDMWYAAIDLSTMVVPQIVPVTWTHVDPNYPEKMGYLETALTGAGIEGAGELNVDASFLAAYEVAPGVFQLPVSIEANPHPVADLNDSMIWFSHGGNVNNRDAPGPLVVLRHHILRSVAVVGQPADVSAYMEVTA